MLMPTQLKKQFSTYFIVATTFLLASILSFSFMACSDNNDDSDSNDASIVGLWQTDPTKGEFTMLRLNSDNTGFRQIFENGTGHTRRSLEYTYNVETKLLTIIIAIEPTENNGLKETYYETHFYNVIELTSQKLVLKNTRSGEDSHTHEFFRQ